MHCADEGFEKPLPHLFEAAVFLMGFTLWGKLEFNKRDGFLDCPHGDRVCGGGMVSKVESRYSSGFTSSAIVTSTVIRTQKNLPEQVFCYRNILPGGTSLNVLQ